MNRTLRRPIALLGLFLALFPLPVPAAERPAAAAAAPKTVVCFGDSITKAGYPVALANDLKVDVVNAGVGGNTTAMALTRLQKDVIDRRPAVVVIFFGTNDSRLAEPEVHVPLEKFAANLDAIAAACEKGGARVAFCTPPPIDAEQYFKRHKKAPFDAAGGLQKVLDDYRAAVVKVADARKAPVVDLSQILKARPEWMAPDGVHPTAEGTKIIAKEVARVVEPLLK